jgi:spore maturation protein CgeB
MPCALLVGNFPSGQGVLEDSYARAFEAIGYRVVRFDFHRRIAAEHRLHRTPRLARLIPDRAARHEVHRDLVTTAMREQPDLVVVFGRCAPGVGSLAQLATSTPCKCVLVWPDTLTHMDTETAVAVRLYDLVACYGLGACESFRRLGARAVEWVPLAADPALHGTLAGAPMDERYDVTFIGNWRPEREEALSAVAALPGVNVRIWGADAWRKKTRHNAVIQAAIAGAPIFGEDFARVVRQSRLNLNIIDDTNFPCANMRFFEIPCAGGLQVSSPCPEMEGALPDRTALFYYRGARELTELVKELLADTEQRRRVASEGHARVMAAHTYEHRVRQITTAALR